MRLKIDSANVFGAAEVDRAGEANDERGKMDTFWFLRLGLSLPHLSVLINQPRKETLIHRVQDGTGSRESHWG